jgi:hypothetical protein
MLQAWSPIRARERAIHNTSSIWVMFLGFFGIFMISWWIQPLAGYSLNAR